MSRVSSITMSDIDAALAHSHPIRPRPAQTTSPNGTRSQTPRTSAPSAAANTTRPASDAPTASVGGAAPPVEWSDPIDLDEAEAAPSFPVDALSPVAARDFIRAAATAYAVPPDLPALAWLALASGCVTSINGVRARVEVGPDWHETPNLYAAVALPSGARKSAVFEALIAPVRAHERALVEASRPALARLKSERAVKIARQKRLEDTAAKGKGSADSSREAEDLAAELAASREPVEPRLLCEDSSPEKLVGLLADHGQLILASPECDIIGSFKGRYSDKGGPNLSVFLKAHSGEELIVDRVGRPSERVPSPLLSILMCGQPDALASLVSDSVLRDRGLVNRFLFAAPPSPLGRRQLHPPPLPNAVREAYREMMTAALQRTKPPSIPSEPSTAGGSEGIEGESADRLITLTDAARSVLDTFRAELEPTMLEGGDFHHAPGWASKAPGAVARIAAVMTLIEDPERTTIDEATMIRAVKIGRWCVAHALRIFSLGNADPDLGAARRMLAWLRRRGRQTFSRRDAYLALKGVGGTSVQRVDEIDGPLRVLCEYGWIAPLGAAPRPQGAGGRAPSPEFAVHPRVWSEGASHSTEPLTNTAVKGRAAPSGAPGDSQAQSDLKVG